MDTPKHLDELSIAGTDEQSQERDFSKRAGPFDHLPRCQARARSTGQRCKNPALKGRTTCYMHGGHAGAPLNNVNARRHGLRGREYRAIRAELRRIKRVAKSLDEARQKAARLQKLAERVDAETDAALADAERNRRAAFVRAMRKLLDASRAMAHQGDVENSPEWDLVKQFIPPGRRQ